MLDSSLRDRYNGVFNVDVLAGAPIQAIDDAASDTDRRALSPVGFADAMHDTNAAFFAEIAVHCPALLCRTSPYFQLRSELRGKRKEAVGRKTADVPNAEADCFLQWLQWQ